MVAAVVATTWGIRQKAARDLCVERFAVAIGDYVRAMQADCLNLELVDELREAYEQVKTHSSRRVRAALEIDDVRAFVRAVALHVGQDSTSPAPGQLVMKPTEAEVVDLGNYLSKQRQTMDESA